jgi:hypothetical protein
MEHSACVIVASTSEFFSGDKNIKESFSKSSKAARSSKVKKELKNHPKRILHCLYARYRSAFVPVSTQHTAARLFHNIQQP